MALCEDELGGGRRRASPPLHVLAMALALVLAAALGSVAGLIWEISGLGGDGDDAAPAGDADADAHDADAGDADAGPDEG